MSNFIHKNLADGRWSKFNLAEQFANIGSEVGRAVIWKKKGNQKYASMAFERALELLDLTLCDERWKKRLKEIARLREFLVGSFYDDDYYKTSLDDLDKYFYYFAFYARNK